MYPSFCGTVFNQGTDKIHIQEDRYRRNNKHRHDRTRNRTGKQLDRVNNTSREINLYQDLMVSNEEKIGPLMTQMEQWSILSNILNYVQHSSFSSMNHTLDVKAMNKYKSKHNTEREFKELDFGTMPQKLQEEYMDIYERIHSEIVSSNRFHENSDISTTYLGRVENKDNWNKLKVEESFPILENGYTFR